ncbi:CHAD domain-containing protein [Streptomyces sp. SID4919]|uniref:CYTH and CHAD domain-containing protein n=1 Tax=unclassified Streptomyces TaxID=2593676 RepID=UPI0008239F66|nr:MULTISPECIES: CYTH and CHAD domain-containing protein [unclassified Streptomyces]MYY12893.1 CHAD domain-containing protein [Streptomyces sp. SID4919]SCK21934.1 CHAD domain-containing protein [Streptomyces sp. AmelKG-E11A]
MADTKREIERKYEARGRDTDATSLPDLTAVGGVSALVHRGVTELDAVYYDTADQRLAAASITLRRRTGGDDAGWHLKLPVADGVRDEIRAPLSAGVPRVLVGLVRSRIRDAPLLPVVRLRSLRDVHHLVDSDGVLLAELSVDVVTADRLSGGDGSTGWTEIEVELADDQEPAFLDKVEKKLKKGGLRRSKSASKLARALAETAPVPVPAPVPEPAAEAVPVSGAVSAEAGPASEAVSGPATGTEAGPAPDAVAVPGAAPVSAPGAGPDPAVPPHTAAAPVLAYLTAQREALVNLDPAVRRDEHDSVHRMRVATRRMRSAFRSYGKVLDRTVTDPIGDELKWLAGELGVDRDAEVLTERLTGHLTGLPRTLTVGPVRTRLRTWAHARRGGSRRRLIAVLDGKRYLTLLNRIDALLAAPPLLPAAHRDPAKVIRKAAAKDFGKLSALVEDALARPRGPERDLAMHDARKKAKRLRYAAEAALDTLGAPAKDAVRGAKALQGLLGEHQDSVMTRGALRDIAAQAQGARESSFTYGLVYGREEHLAAGYEDALPEAWEEAQRRTREIRGTR